MIGSIVYSAIPQSANPVNSYQKEITLESDDKDLSKKELDLSVKIISKRLEGYGVKLFTIYPIHEKSQIQLNFKKKQNISEIADLLCAKGQLYFSETYSSKKILSRLSDNDVLFSILERGQKNNSAELGKCLIKNAEKLSEYLGYSGFRSKVPKDARFAWGKISNERANQLSLYTLKIDVNRPVVLTDEAIENIKLDLGNKKQPTVFIEFHKNGATLWQKMTSINIDKSIAILLDQQVYFSPIVKSEIKGGNCVLTGDFTKGELKSFVSIVKNGKLPSSFHLK